MIEAERSTPRSLALALTLSTLPSCVRVSQDSWVVKAVHVSLFVLTVSVCSPPSLVKEMSCVETSMVASSTSLSFLQAGNRRSRPKQAKRYLRYDFIMCFCVWMVSPRRGGKVEPSSPEGSMWRWCFVRVRLVKEAYTPRRQGARSISQAPYPLRGERPRS